MVAITFPSNPTVGQVFTTGNLSYIWTGTVWASNNIATVDASNVVGLDAALAEIVDAAPAALDTLNELAAALGDDANFAATVTSQLAGKAASVHTHAQSDVTGLTTALAGKADASHTQNASTIITSSNDKAASYTIVAGDKNTFIRSTSATAITITLANVLAVGETINFIQWGAGQVTFAAGAGVTIGSVDSKLKINKQYSGATVTCVASGVYSLVGDLAA